MEVRSAGSWSRRRSRGASWRASWRRGSRPEPLRDRSGRRGVLLRLLPWHGPSGTSSIAGLGLPEARRVPCSATRLTNPASTRRSSGWRSSFCWSSPSAWAWPSGWWRVAGRAWRPACSRSPSGSARGSSILWSPTRRGDGHRGGSVELSRWRATSSGSRAAYPDQTGVARFRVGAPLEFHCGGGGEGEPLGLREQLGVRRPQRSSGRLRSAERLPLPSPACVPPRLRYETCKRRARDKASVRPKAEKFQGVAERAGTRRTWAGGTFPRAVPRAAARPRNPGTTEGLFRAREGSSARGPLNQENERSLQRKPRYRVRAAGAPREGRRRTPCRRPPSRRP